VELHQTRTQARAKPSDYWNPQPKQAQLLQACGLTLALNGGIVQPAICEKVGYGGAAFGGKTDGLLGIALAVCMQSPGARVGYFRRTYPELEGSDGPIDRSMGLFHNIASYNKTKHSWEFPNGSKIIFSHCQYENDVYAYQSQAFDVLLIDEATHFSWFIIDYLLTRNRKSHDSQIPRPFAVMTTNPGGIGHLWYMQLYDVDKTHGEHGQVKNCVTPNGVKEETYFIPAYLEDNVIGIDRDPGYEQRLMSRDPVVARALRFGDWSVFSGQIFREWDRSRHIVKPFEIPEHWSKWRSLDWGYAAPMSCLWWAKDPDTGRMYVYRELYKTGLNDPTQARTIIEKTLPSESINFTFADPSMWTRRTTTEIVTSSYDTYLAEGIMLTKADNSHENKLRKVHAVLGNLPDLMPGLQIFDTCTNLIRTLPAMVNDPKHPEEILDGQEDHSYDSLAYGLTNWRDPGMIIKKKAQKSWKQPISGISGL
jgi:phage terminase large subunit